MNQSDHYQQSKFWSPPFISWSTHILTMTLHYFLAGRGEHTHAIALFETALCKTYTIWGEETNVVINCLDFAAERVLWATAGETCS